MSRPQPDDELLDAVLAIASHLDLEEVLDLIVQHACRLTGAAYGALGVLSQPNTHAPVLLERFHHTGLTPEHARRMGHPPRGHGVLGVLIDDPRPLRLTEIAAHTASVGLPANHPPMHTFLGVPIRVRDTVFGNLYLCEKAERAAFTDADERLVVGLAAAAGIAVENARLYADAVSRQRWLAAGAEVSTQLRRHVEPAAELIARLALSAGNATTAAVGLAADDAPGPAFATRPEPAALEIDAAVGEAAAAMTGQPVPLGPELMAAAATLFAARPDDALAVELRAGETLIGLLALHRADAPWTPDERAAVTAYADHVALTIDQIHHEHDRRRLAVYTDRDRIARDLHDRVIQRIFATGLGLHSVLSRATEPQLQQRLSTAIDDLHVTIAEVRAAIFSLHNDAEVHEQPLREGVLAIVAESERVLGFSPAVTFLGPVDDPLPGTVAADLLATVREALSNVVRHAEASSVDVVVQRDASAQTLSLRVSDDGVGIDPTVAKRDGLRNVGVRARSSGGTAQVGRRPEGGSYLSWVVPVAD